MKIENLTGMSDAEFVDLAREIGGHGSLVQALAFAPTILEVVIQDEYTHDVVLGARDGLVLVYDTT